MWTTRRGRSASGPHWRLVQARSAARSDRAVEALGYDTFGLADRFVRPFAPLIAGHAVADATTTLRVTKTVLASAALEAAFLADSSGSVRSTRGARTATFTNWSRGATSVRTAR